jgi:hypothetical protein
VFSSFRGSGLGRGVVIINMVVGMLIMVLVSTPRQ